MRSLLFVQSLLAAVPGPPPPAGDNGAATNLDERSVDALLEIARQLFANLDYEETIPVTKAILSREGAPGDARMDAYVIYGSSLAIMGLASEAEQTFRLLLRARPDFNMLEKTPPKILRIFRSVKVEEEQIIAETRALERSRIIQELEATGSPPESVNGGAPIPFAYAIKDMRGVVKTVRVHYRWRGADAYSTLPLNRDETGRWTGAIPGAMTASDDGKDLEFFVTTHDVAGDPLLQIAAPSQVVHAFPGRVSDGTPFYQRWWFWVATGVVLAAGGVAGGVVYDITTRLPPGDVDPIPLQP